MVYLMLLWFTRQEQNWEDSDKPQSIPKEYRDNKKKKNSSATELC